MEDRKTQILDIAEELILSGSYNSFSYNDISKQLGITKASIHHHFPAKEDLGVAVCDRLHSLMTDYLAGVDAFGGGPEKKVEMYTGLLRTFLDKKTRICPFGIMEAEYNVIPERMRECLKAMFTDMSSWLTGVVREGRQQGAFRYEGEPHDQALLIFSALQGSLQISRLEGVDRLTAVARQAMDSMRA
jgi:TetR/AcrR family transcriptional repressor of nem operon